MNREYSDAGKSLVGQNDSDAIEKYVDNRGVQAQETIELPPCAQSDDA